MDRPSIIFLLFALFLVALGCSKTPDSPPAGKEGRVEFEFSHLVGGVPVRFNDLTYTNAAGNHYLVSGIKYFISDITFYRPDGTKTTISRWSDIFFIDEDIPTSKKILFYDLLPAATYDSVGFIFGIAEQKNKSFMFVNPPEVNMAWPEVLGGGYHYMMLDGKWVDTTGFLQPFNFHLGIGQLYHGSGYDTDSIYAFVQNYFRVSLPGSSFTLEDKDTLRFSLRMDIESWFASPRVFDFDHWGGAIMQNQAAMEVARENGRDVFSIQLLDQ